MEWMRVRIVCIQPAQVWSRCDNGGFSHMGDGSGIICAKRLHNRGLSGRLKQRSRHDNRSKPVAAQEGRQHWLKHETT